MSTKRTWTPAQTSAMEARGRTLLVSAAAGSGKTATLTERIIRRITDSEHPAELSRMLIVTFTKTAAAELKQRISDAIAERIALDPANKHLQKQLLQLGSSHIHTIDAFCLQPVKDNFAEMGMPASFRIADDAELLPLSERIFGELIDEFYLKYAPDEQNENLFSLLENNVFADLCDSLTPSKNDASLTQTFRTLYNKLLNFTAGLERLKTQAQRLDAQASGDFLASDHGKILKEWMLLFCASSIRFFKDALAIISQSPEATKAYYNGFDSELTFLVSLEGLLKQGSYQDVQQHLRKYELGKLTGLTNAAPIYAELRESKNAIAKIIRSFRDIYFKDDTDTISQEMRTLSQYCAVLYDFLKAYDERIGEEKLRRGICDFTDNRRKLLRMLMDDKGEPTPLCLSYLENFDEVYIDEYQDVDEVQDTIFRLIGGNHRFMVGDIKQSIYGFRGTDPSVFAGYRNRLTPLSQGEDMNGNSIFMSNNFRCDESVIRVTNAVCSHIFSACPDSIGYLPEDDLVFSKKKPSDDYVSPPVHIALIESLPRGSNKDGLVENPEAVYVANQIAKLLRSGARKANGELIRPQDIAILSRGGTLFGEYIAALSSMGIPTGCAELEKVRATRDMLHGPDMIYLLNLLRVINNPDNDIPLSEILRGDFPAMTLDEVIILRQNGEKHGSLFSALESYERTKPCDATLLQKVNAFLAWLAKYRSLSMTLSAEGLLRVLKQDKRVGCRQTKAFTYLYDSARTCRVAPFVGLYTFLSYVENKILTSKNAPADEDVQIEGGTVKLMTIHKSKGLEFPVCFVVGCGQAFKDKDAEKDLLFDKSSGIATKFYDRSEQRKHETLLRCTSAIAIKSQTREDEMRILYVAMTRARERLYLIGYDGNDKNFAGGDRYEALTCNDCMTWIKAGLAVHEEVAPFYELVRISEADITPDEVLPPIQELADKHEEDPLAAHYKDIANKVKSPSRMEALVRSVPTKVPASQMSDKLLDECVFVTSNLSTDNKDDLPVSDRDGSFCHVATIENVKRAVRLMTQSQDNNEFELLLKANARPTSAEKGTATHLFLQHCDWQRVKTHGLEEEISRLAEEGFITPRVCQILDRKQLTAFFDSQFIQLAMSAKRIQRELKFQRFVPLRDLTDDVEFAQALGDKTLYVRGSIDLVCHFADGRMVLCDYKTDRLTDDELTDRNLLAAHLKEKHGAQLRQYAVAMEELYSKRPDSIYIFSLPLGEAVEIDL